LFREKLFSFTFILIRSGIPPSGKAVPVTTPALHPLDLSIFKQKKNKEKLRKKLEKP
jgi:hypothetical protein